MNALDIPMPNASTSRWQEPSSLETMERAELEQAYRALLCQKEALDVRIRKSEERRRAFIHILSDLKAVNSKLADQRKAMIHILADYEQDRSRLAKQTERLDNSRRALMHILQDSHHSNLRLEKSRKAMIHIMSDLKETTEAVQRREQELLMSSTTRSTTSGCSSAMPSICSNWAWRTPTRDRFCRNWPVPCSRCAKPPKSSPTCAPLAERPKVSYEPIAIEQVVQRSISLLHEQLRLRQIELHLYFPAEDVVVLGNAIQIEQVFLNLLTNARDAMSATACKQITITCQVREQMAEIRVSDTGTGIAPGVEQRVFDPFFTTKDVGAGTGLGLSITYGIIKDHGGTIELDNHPGAGATFVIWLPLYSGEGIQEVEV